MNLKSAFWRITNVFRLKLKGAKIGKRPDIKYNIYLKIAKDSKVVIGNNVTFYSDCNLNPLSRNLRGGIATSPGAEVIIGNNVGISATAIRARKSIRIGDRVTIGADCIILDSDGHSLDYRNRGTDADIPVSKPIVIEEDVLLGARSIVLKGVHIGARSVIGSGSVVVKDIPADCIAVGNPCKVIRTIDDWSKIHRGGVKIDYNHSCQRSVLEDNGNIITVNGEAQLHIGKNTIIRASNIWSHKNIFIGDNTIIEQGVMIIDSDCHSLDYKDRGTERDMHNKVDKAIHIGNNVLIGERCIINKGCSIGDRSIIQPGSVVTSNIPNDCIAGGNPCKIIQKLSER